MIVPPYLVTITNLKIRISHAGMSNYCAQYIVISADSLVCYLIVDIIIVVLDWISQYNVQ